MPSIKSEVSREAVFRVLANLAWHCNEQDQNRVWVGSIKQATETKMGRSTILLARKALLQAGWLIDLKEKEKFGAWVYRLDIPGFAEWLTGTNSHATNSQTDINDVGTSTGMGTELSTGMGTELGTGLSTGTSTGLSNGANSQPQTELNKTNLNTTEQNSEQTLLKNAVRLELTVKKSQIPFENICNAPKKQAEFLPVVKQVLKMFGDKSANDRDCAVYVLSKIHPDNEQFKCSYSTYQTLNERYCQPAPEIDNADNYQLIDTTTAEQYADEAQRQRTQELAEKSERETLDAEKLRLNETSKTLLDKWTDKNNEAF